MDTGDRHAGDAPIGIDDPDKRGLPVTLACQVVPIGYFGGIGGAQVDLVDGVDVREIADHVRDPHVPESLQRNTIIRQDAAKAIVGYADVGFLVIVCQ